MDKLLQERAGLIRSAKSLIDQRQKEGVDLTDGDRGQLKEWSEQLDSVESRIEAAKADSGLLNRFKGAKVEEPETPGEGQKSQEVGASSLGEHVVKSLSPHFSELKASPGLSFYAPEFDHDPEGVKAPTTQTVGAWGADGTPLLTQYDRTIVRRTLRDRPFLADLLGVGRIGNGTNAISYLLENPAVEGGFGNVAEGGAKPQISFGLPTWATDAARKIAGHIKFSDEFLEDLAFLKTEVDERLLNLLAMREEAQLLNGDGTGQNLLGLLNRSGVQVENSANSADDPDAVFRAITKVSTATELSADGIVIHPLDYQKFRLTKDGNGQYFGGGFFEGQYGNGGGLAAQPPLWGLRTIVTPNVAVGKPLVGAFRQATTLYRKGGVRVDATNSHVDDFTNNLVTVRVEERVALAVRQPAGLVKVTLSTYTPPAG
ncbi:major capsid protein [Gordonia phage Ghobes]|uniref:Major capsid protein n=1 Tax=Gordonia phage Ghobes TaxID=1887647 RepID=A0A1B3B052_9CAUD|nr:major capsid protein [Gordonia phage Ghobes]AOE44358.1 major capsid protein [Gordonia phage Ghobes]